MVVVTAQRVGPELLALLLAYASLLQCHAYAASDEDAVTALAGQLDLDLGVSDGDHDRSTFGRPRVRRSRASSAFALASSLIALAAASPYASGRTIVGGAGQGVSRHLGVRP